VLAALSIALSGRASMRMLLGGTLLMSVLFLVFGLSTNYALSMFCMFGVGVGMIIMAASANTLIQLTVPDHLRGRVMAVYTTVFAGSTPIGGLVTGGLASAYGIQLACVVGGILAILVAVGGMLYAVRHPQVITLNVRAAPAAAPIV
jgi:MFS family permease